MAERSALVSKLLKTKVYSGTHRRQTVSNQFQLNLFRNVRLHLIDHAKSQHCSVASCTELIRDIISFRHASLVLLFSTFRTFEIEPSVMQKSCLYNACCTVITNATLIFMMAKCKIKGYIFELRMGAHLLDSEQRAPCFKIFTVYT